MQSESAQQWILIKGAIYAMSAVMIGAFAAQGLDQLLDSYALDLILFSGSLYLLAFTHVKWLGVITPTGGIAFILVWLVSIRKGIVSIDR